MLNQKEILSTIAMIDQQHLDIRTITMGISLLSCCVPDAKKACDKIYEKITRYAEKLVKTGEDIEREFGIPIVNSYNNRSILNISGQWVCQDTKMFIKENSFRINIGLTFNERWFAKWKVE